MVLLFLAVPLSGCVGGPLNPEGPIEKDPMDTPPQQAEDGGWDLSVYGVNGDPFLGAADAEVQVIAYDAPACVNCRRYHDAVLPEIKEAYIDTGRIGYHFLQWKVYPGSNSYDILGGIAEECAYREGGVEAYIHAVDLVFEQAAQKHDSDALPGILQEVATTFALDNDALQACHRNEDTRDEVLADIDFGKSSGAGSNPGFAVLGPDGFVKHIRGSSGPGDAIAEALGDA